MPIKGKVLASTKIDYGDAPFEDLTSAEIQKIKQKADKLFEMGDYVGAAEIYEQIVAWEQRSLGPEHPDTTNSLHYLASLYNSQGLFKSRTDFFACISNL